MDVSKFVIIGVLTRPKIPIITQERIFMSVQDLVLLST